MLVVGVMAKVSCFFFSCIMIFQGFGRFPVKSRLGDSFHEISFN